MARLLETNFDPESGKSTELWGDYAPAATPGELVARLMAITADDDLKAAAFAQGSGWEHLLRALRAPDGAKALADRVEIRMEQDRWDRCVAFRAGDATPSWAWEVPTNNWGKRWPAIKAAIGAPDLAGIQGLVLTVGREMFVTYTLKCGAPARLVGAVVDLLQPSQMDDLAAMGSGA